MGRYQSYGRVLGTLSIRCRSIIWSHLGEFLGGWGRRVPQENVYMRAESASDWEVQNSSKVMDPTQPAEYTECPWLYLGYQVLVSHVYAAVGKP